jgi:hypothetical protein
VHLIRTKFDQADETIAKKFGGTGLGMSIVDELVRAHGGNVRLESTVGVGSKFIVTIPLILAEAEGTPTVPRGSHLGGNTGGSQNAASIDLSNNGNNGNSKNNSYETYQSGQYMVNRRVRSGIHACVSVSECVCVCVCLSVCLYVCMYTRVCVFLYVCKCISHIDIYL